MLQLLLCVLVLVGTIAAQSTSPSTAPSPATASPAQTNVPAPSASDPQNSAAPPTATPPTATPQNGTAPQDAGAPQDAAPSDDESTRFVFKKEIEEVVLHATVVDDQNRLITGLGRDQFQVLEDNKAQKITSFRTERVPVALGILIDNSGSMLSKRAKVNQAALRLVDGSQQDDRVFVVNFGEDAYLDQDYTQDVDKLKAALLRIDTRGSTALYDAIIGAVDHLNQTSSLPKKVLLVVTDGKDNASQATFEQVLRKLQSKNGPVLYTIALEQNDRGDDAYRQNLRTLSQQTGGTAFFPSSLDEVQSIATAIAQDIRSQYIIGYRSSNSHATGLYHTIEVKAFQGPAPLRVQTRTGYYSGNLGSH